MGPPYSDCVEKTESEKSYDSELYKLTVQKIKKYDQEYCLALCNHRYLKKMCTCQGKIFFAEILIPSRY